MKNGGPIGKRLRKTPPIARITTSASEKIRLNILKTNAARTLVPWLEAFEPLLTARYATLVCMIQAID